MKALVYHGPGQRSWDTVARSGHRRPDRRDRPHRQLARSAEPTCTSSRATCRRRPRARSSAMRRSAPSQEVGAARDDAWPPATACWCRASAPAGAAASARRPATASASAAAAGSSATRSTASRPSTRARRSPTTRSTRCPTELSDEQVLFLADILPTAYEVGVLAGMVRPGDVVAIVGAGPIGLAAILTARLFTPSQIVAIDLADSRLARAARVRRRHDDQQRHAEDADARGSWSSPTASAPTWPSRRSASRRRSSSPPSLIRPGGHVANIGVHGAPRDAAPRDRCGAAT